MWQIAVEFTGCAWVFVFMATITVVSTPPASKRKPTPRQGRGGEEDGEKERENEKKGRLFCLLQTHATVCSVGENSWDFLHPTWYLRVIYYLPGGPLFAVKVSSIALLGQLYQLLSCCDGPTIGFTSPRKSTVVPPRNAASTLPPSLPSSPPLN